MRYSCRLFGRVVALIVALSLLAFVGSEGATSVRGETIPAPSGERVTIIRDTSGVPHIFADTLEGMSFGAGYALAQDRLWQMEVLRHIAKGRLSELVGPAGLGQDRTVRFFTYTAEERANRFATYPEEIQRGIRAFVDGINLWVFKAQTIAANRPAEFGLFGVPITDWTVDDTIALEDVLILAFGSGGGNELSNAALLNFLIGKYGQGHGVKAFKDTIWINDPASPTSIPPDYQWKNSPTYARAEADSDFKLNLHLTDARLGLAGAATAAGSASASADTDDDSFGRLRDGLPLFSDQRELALGTDPYLACAADTTADNEEPDPQPEDLNDDQAIAGADLSRLAAVIGQTVPPAAARRDLNLDGAVTGADLSLIAGSIGKSCAMTEDQALLAQLSLIPDFAPVQEALDVADGLEALKAMITFGSNAQLVSPSLAAAGNSLQTAGPQVGYLVPQFLVEFGLHGGGVDTVGMTFAGAGPAVLIGAGMGFSWTTTTGASDLTDTYIEKLNPANSRQYLFRGTWEDMDCRTESFTFRGLPLETREICRTRHGPVLAFDTANNVAYSLRYSWFNAEKGTVEGFFGYNKVRSLEDFATAANLLTSNHNMFYSDDKGNSGYWHPGAHPIRQPFVDLRLPQDGAGKSEWRGIRRAQDVPHAVNLPRGWLANWNNKPSVDWDREVGWGAVFKVQTLHDVLDPTQPRRLNDEGNLLNPDGPISWEDLNDNLRYAAFREHNADYFLPFLPTGSAATLEQEALDEVQAWNRFLLDRDEDCRWDSAGATIFQRWLGNMRSMAFDDELGPHAGRSSTSMLLHVLQGNSAALKPHFDWLGAETPSQLAARALTRTVAQLSAEFGNSDPSTWKGRASYQHYTRANADTVPDTFRTRGCPYRGSASPGDIPDHIRMDRGTYNHIVAYDGPPSPLAAPLGLRHSQRGSVIPPGQSGFINSADVESPPNYPVPGQSPGGHYRDQFDNYLNWTYKPMPLSEGEARGIMESEEEITY